MVLKPVREHATNNSQTYFVTSKTWEGRQLFSAEPWARLFFKTLLSHQGKSFLLHEFALMPDHFHLLITPSVPLERTIQPIKGGFSFRAKKDLRTKAEIWQRGFSDHRIRDAKDYDRHVHYIHLNPVKNHLCAAPAEYRYSSAYPGWRLDPIPQGLKPGAVEAELCGTTKVVPFQNKTEPCGTAEAASFQNKAVPCGTAELVPLQNEAETCGTAEAVPFQSHDSTVLISDETEAVSFRSKDSFSPDNSSSFQHR